VCCACVCVCVCVCVCFVCVPHGFSASFVLMVVKFIDVMNFTATGFKPGKYSLTVVWLRQNMLQYTVSHILNAFSSY
jgi:hypothetical protein